MKVNQMNIKAIGYFALFLALSHLWGCAWHVHAALSHFAGMVGMAALAVVCFGGFTSKQISIIKTATKQVLLSVDKTRQSITMIKQAPAKLSVVKTSKIASLVIGALFVASAASANEYHYAALDKVDLTSAQMSNVAAVEYETNRQIENLHKAYLQERKIRDAKVLLGLPVDDSNLIDLRVKQAQLRRELRAASENILTDEQKQQLHPASARKKQTDNAANRLMQAAGIPRQYWIK